MDKNKKNIFSVRKISKDNNIKERLRKKKKHFIFRCTNN